MFLNMAHWPHASEPPGVLAKTADFTSDLPNVGECYGLNVRVLLRIHVEILTSNAIALGSEASERWLDREGGALLSGVCALIKEAREGSMWSQRKRVAMCSYQTMNLPAPGSGTSQPAELWGKFPLFKQLSLWYSVIAAWTKNKE